MGGGVSTNLSIGAESTYWPLREALWCSCAPRSLNLKAGRAVHQMLLAAKVGLPMFCVYLAWQVAILFTYKGLTKDGKHMEHSYK
jgi:hypothetical protein